LARAVGATKERSVGFDSVTDNFTAAVRALRRHRLDGTLKAIKDMRLARCGNLKCFIVFIATSFTLCHFPSLL
jgi:hypothetical protein